MNLHGIQTILLSALGVAASSAASLAGCGGSFDVPKDHFDGVDEFGYVSYWDKIADIDIGEDAPLPLVIGFKSNRDTSSPYLGHGWVMPLLESYMIQTGENTFEIMKPTGYTSGFGRDPKSPTTIGGVKGWKGEIGSNTIKVWAPCGWSLTYTLGRLTEMGTPKGKRVIVKRDQAGQVEDVTMDGRVLVKVVKGLAGKVDGLEVEGKKYDIALGEKPRIQSVQGKNLIVGKDLSLEKISRDNKPENFLRFFSYGVENDLKPSLLIEKPEQAERKIIWNITNFLISQDGDWKYNIIPSEKNNQLTSIGRKNEKGQTEAWDREILTGKSIIQEINGKKRISTWFTSGALTGKLKEIVEIEPKGLIKIIEKNTWNEDGLLIRKLIGNIEYHFNWNNGNLKSITKKEYSETIN